MKLGNKNIGLSNETYFIAEIGSNFDGDLNRAKDLIALANEAGANAVKFQHYTADSLVSDAGFNAMNKQVSHQANWTKSVSETYRDAALDKEWTDLLKFECHSLGMEFYY